MGPLLAFCLVVLLLRLDEILDCLGLGIEVVVLINSEVSVVAGDLLREEGLHVVSN